MKRWSGWLLGMAVLGGMAGCGPDKDHALDGGSGTACGTGGVARPADSCGAPAAEDLAACTPGATDYQPRDNTPGDDGWPACVSDDNAFHLVGTGLPAASSRVAAFESMAKKLWNNPNVPTAADFLSARDDYSVTEGIASRIARRQDVTYAEVPGNDKFACASEGIPAQYPDRCAGPAKLKPILDDAFQQGAACLSPLTQAARIEAALLWFFHLSMTSEVWTCGFDDITDCDSAAAYYTREPRRSPSEGYAKYVATLAPGTHDRIFDALLAERCWRDADQAMPAANTALYERAQAQLQQASLRGIAVILRDRMDHLRCSTGEAWEAHRAFVAVLGGLLDHAASTRDAAAAARLRTFVQAPTAVAADIAAAQAELDALFGCP